MDTSNTEIQQRTPEWEKTRTGKVTGSKIADLLAKTKSGPAASRKNYLAQLVCERLTGQKANGFMSAEMQWGIDHEAEARELYSALTYNDVTEIGFVDHPTIAMAGCSPDGLVGDDGLIEIKCPNTATHIENLLRRDADPKYNPQMQMQMACTGRKWCDFVSFDPRLPGDLSIFIHRVERDEAFIAEMEKEITTFLEELDATVEALRHYNDAPAKEEAPKKKRGRAA